MRLFKKLPQDMFQILNGVGSLQPDLIERHLNKKGRYFADENFRE